MMFRATGYLIRTLLFLIFGIPNCTGHHNNQSFSSFFFWHVTCQRLLIRCRSFLILGTEKVTLQQNPFFLLLFFFSWQRNTFVARTEFIFTGSKTFNKPGWNLELPGFVTEKIILDLKIEKKKERRYEHQMWIILLRLQRILNFFL